MLITGVRVQVPPRAPISRRRCCSPPGELPKKYIRCARVVELADSLDSGSSAHYGRAGSSPASRTKKKDTLKACLSFWVPRAVGPLHPSVIQMLGGSTRKGYATSVRRQSRQRLCGEFRLRRGFACGKTLVRRIGAAGQKAGWVVLLYLFEISCGRNVRFAATSFYTCGKKEVIRPIPAPPLQPRPALRAAFTIEKPSTLTVSPTRRKHSVLSAGFCDILVYNDERSRLWSLTG